MSAITERRDMGLMRFLKLVPGMLVCSSFLITVYVYCVEIFALVYVFVGYVSDGDYVSQLPCVGYYVFVKSMFSTCS